MLEAMRHHRETRRQRRVHAEYLRRQELHRPGYKVWGYKNSFAQGFLITPSSRPLTTGTWRRLRLGTQHLQHDPWLEVQQATQDGLGVTVLGQAFDDRGPTKRDRVASRLLRTALRAGNEPQAQVQALDQKIAWLAGRYVVLFTRGDRLDVWGDPLATRSVYFHGDTTDVSLASHSALLAELAGGLTSKQYRWALSHPEYRSPAGKWIPGLITTHDGVGQLYANGRLTVESGHVTHRRFFPQADRVELSPRRAAEDFRAELSQQVKNWISVAPTTVVTLTAGRDSRAILEAGLPDLQRVEALALTYHPFHVPQKSTLTDLTTGSRLAIAAGLHHLPVNVGAMSPRSPFAKLYNETFPLWKRYPALAHGLYLQAPAKAATIFGIGGAIITGMYKDTSAPAPTPEVLASKYAQSKFAQDPALIEEMARWMEFTQFSNDALRGYDFHDFFHWEHRMTKWGGYGYSELDLATIPAPVLSSRRLLMAALSLPKPLRVDALVYRYISEGDAALPD